MPPADASIKEPAVILKRDPIGRILKGIEECVPITGAKG
jgi:hypothetical protein